MIYHLDGINNIARDILLNYLNVGYESLAK